MGDREYCITDAKCNLPPPRECSDSEFQCESGNSYPIKSPPYGALLLWGLITPKLHTGSCIKLRLKCNSDYDCEDGSDEDCEPLRKTCPPTVLDTNEQGRTAGYGYDRSPQVLDFG